MQQKRRRSYAGSTTLLKELNRSLVLDALRQQGSLSRSELAGLTGLTAATISNIVEELIADGYVKSEGQGESQGGRKPTLLSLVAGARQVVAVDVAVDRVTVALTDLLARPLAVEVLPSPTGKMPLAVVEEVAATVNQLVERRRRPPVLGVGVAFPGPTDVEGGIALTAPNLPGWDHVPLGDLLAERVKLPVHVENDANAAALGERSYGAARGVRHLIFLLLDLGIGGGFLFGGEIYRGFQGAAGEVGHMIIDINGRRCGCGSTGCLETVASGIALTRRLAERVGKEEREKLSLLLDAARADDPQVVSDLKEAARYIGAAVASLANTFNPEMIILGGRLAVEYPPLFDLAVETARPRLLPLIQHHTQIALTSLGRNACLVGAACLVLQRVFRPLRLASTAP